MKETDVIEGVPDISPTPRRFVVDVKHLGNSEAAWASSPKLLAVEPIEIPPVEHVVVVAPHPDDEVLGAGGLLQRLAGHATVEICAVSDGEGSHPDVAERVLRRIRNQEALSAQTRLGLAAAERTRLRYPDGQVSRYEAELAEALAHRLGPTTLCVAPWRGDGHPDHEAGGRAAAAAAASAGAVLFEYLVWAWHWADPLGGEVPWASCRRLSLDRRSAARKRWATAAFHSQTRRFGPDGGQPPILPPPVLRRFWRPFEVFVT